MADDYGPDLRHWMRFRQMAVVDPEATEKGRLLAAHEVATNPEARARVEAAFGIEVCKLHYPEAYRNTRGLFSGVVRVLDAVRERIPW